jgi:hypothetical protein
MKRILILTVFCTLLAASSACGTKKPPEPSAVRTKSALSALKDMTHAYETKDLSSFMAGVAPTLRDREALSKNITSVFAKYDSIQFNVQYAKMIIMIDAANQARVTFTWEAEWKTAGGLSVKDGARGTLVFEQKNNKLVAVEGKNPFIPQPGTTPGRESK